MSVVERVRARFLSEQTRYERAWVTSINVIGLLIVVGIALDSGLLLGTGQTGIFQRALSLGVAVAEGYRRGVLLSASVLVGYTLLLAAVGTLGTALATAPAYPIAGAAGVVAAVGASALATR